VTSSKNSLNFIVFSKHHLFQICGMRLVVSEDILAMLIQAISVAFFQKVDGLQAFEALVA